MVSRLLLSIVCVLLLASGGLEARQAAQAQPPVPGPTQPAPTPETSQPEREGRQGRTTRRRRAPESSQRRESGDALPPRDGGPTRQTLTLSASVLAGYDDNLTAGLGTGTGISTTAMPSGSTGSLDGTLDYRRGNARHDLRVRTVGNLLAYPGYIDAPAAGVSGNMDGKTTVGRRLTLAGGGRVGYEPFFNALSTGLGTPLPPGSTPATPVAGLFESRSLSSNARGSAETRVSRRDTLSASYSFRAQSFLDNEETSDPDTPQPFISGDSSSHVTGAGYKRVVSSGVRARADYEFSDLSYEDVLGNSRPTRTHRIEGGADVEHSTTRGQQLVTWTVTAGAARVEALASAQQLPYTAWLPVGSARLRVPFSPTASIEATYRREFNLLTGVTTEVYATDTAGVSTNFGIAPRTDLRLVGSFGNWKTPVASGASDTFNVYGAGAQLRVLITSAVGFTANYYYYHHRYSNPAGLPEGFPASYDRNAVRLGLTFLLPVVSPPTARAARPAIP